MSIFNKYYSYGLCRKLRRKNGRKRYAQEIQRNRDCSILVILHLFYPESWKEIEQYLMNLEGYFWDLCITYPVEYQDRFDFAAIRAFKPDVQLLAMENRGFDVAPFVMALKQIDLDRYDVVFKIQSKGVRRKWIYIYRQLFCGRDWFINLYEGILGARTVHQTIDALYRQKNVGLVCAENLYVKDPQHKQHLVAKGFAQRGMAIASDYRFVAGTCFAAKAEPMKAVQQLGVSSADFVPVTGSRGLSLGHLMERYLTLAVTQQGYDVATNRVCRLRRWLKKPAEKVLGALSSERLFQTPYRIDDEYFMWQLDNRLIYYKIRQIAVGQLRYWISPEKQLPIAECAPYRYLMGDREGYEAYCRFHEENGLPLMTEKRFQALIASMEQTGYDDASIIIVNDRNCFMDGQHRACYLAWKYGLDYPIKVMDISYINKRGILKLFVPRCMRDKIRQGKLSGNKAV